MHEVIDLISTGKSMMMNKSDEKTMTSGFNTSGLEPKKFNLSGIRNGRDNEYIHIKILSNAIN